MTESPGQRIKRRRIELGYTNQGAFAKLIGMGQSTLSEIERGESKLPNAENLKKICETLNVTDAWVLYGTEGALRYPTEEESEILNDLRAIPTNERAAIYQVIKALIKK